MNLFERAHAGYAAARRVKVLADHFTPLLPDGASLLDVGCGDGALTRLIETRRPDLTVRGIDVHVRAGAAIAVTAFDGQHIPMDADSVDCALFVDVLHHADDPKALLAEGVRVARRHVLIKDHRLEGLLAGATLRFMDRVGNARHGVALPYHYWPEARWRATFRELELEVSHFTRDLGLYPAPVSWIFDRGLHFIARLEVGAT